MERLSVLPIAVCIGTALVVGSGCNRASDSSAPQESSTSTLLPVSFEDTALNGPKFVVSSSSCSTKTVSVMDAHGVPGTTNATFCAGIPYSDQGVVNGNNIYTTLDLYLPENYHAGDAKLPAVVYIHGGGWHSGSSDAVGANQLRYLTLGYAVISLNYRLTCYTVPSDPANPPNFPGACTVRDPSDPQWITFAKNIQDVKTAFQWMRLKLGDIVDADRLIAWGFSAGAHLSLLIGTSEGVPELEGRAGAAVSSRPAAAVAQSPAVEFEGFASPVPLVMNQAPDHCTVPDDYANSRNAVETMLGVFVGQNNPISILGSPITHLDRNDPPMYLLAGTCDATQPWRQSVDFGTLANSIGADVTVKLVTSSVHGGTLNPQYNPGGYCVLQNWIKTKVPPNSPLADCTP